MANLPLKFPIQPGVLINIPKQFHKDEAKVIQMKSRSTYWVRDDNTGSFYKYTKRSDEPQFLVVWTLSGAIRDSMIWIFGEKPNAA